MSSSTLSDGLRRLRRQLAAKQFSDDSDEQLLNAFINRREDSAFAVLMRRHGPMVLHVCRRVLTNEPDAEDAFQATFLALSRNAASLRNKSALASWLHGTAYRTALKARRSAARRRKYEGQTPAQRSIDPANELLWREVRELLDEEISLLPEKYRNVFILCCLEELSQAEAGRRLGLKERTVSDRLATARKRLSQRLSQRGMELTAALAVASLALQPASALPRALITATIEAALTAAGQGCTGLILASKVKIAALVLLIVATSGSFVCWYGYTSEPLLAMREPPAGKPDAVSPKRESAQSVEIQGRVVDPNGNPAPGAKLLFVWRFKDLPPKIWATSGNDGRFVFTVDRSPAANSAWKMPVKIHPYVLAAAEGYGFAAAPLDETQTAAHLTLRLVKDDVPIRGRILNLEGKPIAGVRVRVNDLEPLNQAQLYLPKSKDLSNWLASLKANRKDPWRLEEDHFTELASRDFHLLFPSVTTGVDGRFELRGIGRERMVRLRIEGPTIATQIVNAMTRNCEKAHLPLSRNYPKGQSITYHGATLEILAEPTKPVVGVVRDRDTGKPLAGAIVKPNNITNPFGFGNHNAGLIRAVTDKDGRYRLVGLPKGDDNQLMATTDDLPYLPQSKVVANTPGLGPVTVDFALKRGIWVKGHVLEKTTGKPLEGGVGYYCFRENPHHTDIPHEVIFHGCRTRPDGSYRIVVVPDRGLISVQVSHNDRYLRGVGAEKIKARHIHPGIDCFDTHPFACQIPNCTTLVEINPKPGDESVTCDLIAVPGRSLKGIVLAPDGKPLAGARRDRWDALSGSGFTVWGLPPGKLAQPREIEFVHEGKKLAGFVIVNGEEKEPLQVRLQPWGALTGRLVTAEGEPLSGVAVSCHAGETHTDKQGRFRIEGLTPGLKYQLWISKEGRILPTLGGERKDLTVESGESLDLGKVRVKTAR